MLIHAPFRILLQGQIPYLDVFCTVIDIISVCVSIPIKIPILWLRAFMVGPRPRVLPTLPLVLRILCVCVCVCVCAVAYRGGLGVPLPEIPKAIQIVLN